MCPELLQNLEKVKATFLKYGAEKAFVFGSAMEERFNENSDIDFLFSFPEDFDYERYADNYFALADELENLLNKKIDLVAEKTLVNPYLIQQVNRQKVRIL